MASRSHIVRGFTSAYLTPFSAFLLNEVDIRSRNSYSIGMSSKSTVSEKGQVTIPKAIRDRLGYRPGTVLEFEERDGKLIATKAVTEDVFRKWRGRGKLPTGDSVDAYLAGIREPDAHSG